MTAKSTGPESSADAGQARQRRLRLAVALTLIVLGGLLLAANLGLLRPEARQVVRLLWGTVLLAFGMWLVAGRISPFALAPARFAYESGDIARGDLERASLTADTGAVDLELRALANPGPLAVGEYAGPNEPLFDTKTREASLRLDARNAWHLPASAGWPVELAKGIPWTLRLESSLGDYRLDLSELQIDKLGLYSTFGVVDLTLPNTGAASLNIDLTFGDLTVRVPDGMAVKVKLKAGPLSNLLHDERRFVRLAPDEWVTPLYAVAANRCTLTVRLWAGDLQLR